MGARTQVCYEMLSTVIGETIWQVRSLVVAVVTVATLVVAPVRSIVPPVAAQAGQQREAGERGNPTTTVWVNTRSGVYHCPGTRYYGNTKNGQYMTQAEAQKQGNRPAYGKFCR